MFQLSEVSPPKGGETSVKSKYKAMRILSNLILDITVSISLISCSVSLTFSALYAGSSFMVRTSSCYFPQDCN
jgi:hypothetical protein